MEIFTVMSVRGMMGRVAWEGGSRAGQVVGSWVGVKAASTRTSQMDPHQQPWQVVLYGEDRDDITGTNAWVEMLEGRTAVAISDACFSSVTACGRDVQTSAPRLLPPEELKSSFLPFCPQSLLSSLPRSPWEVTILVPVTHTCRPAFASVVMETISLQMTMDQHAGCPQARG